MDIHGFCDERFAAVRDAFEHNFTAHGDVGASFAATVEGEFVVDLWAGHARPGADPPVGAGHHRQRLLDDEDHVVPLRAAPRGPRTTRLPRQGHRLLAGSTGRTARRIRKSGTS